MRSIRPVPPCPARLDPSTDSAGARERLKAIDHFRQTRPKTFKFKAYSHESVREALNAAFAGKCAYCESFHVVVEPTDIEHYRPKGEVIHLGQPRAVGYYWLATAWENLLPSCIACNRVAGQQFLDEPPRNAGKGSAFPLRDEAARATAPGEECREDPLLLNPYFHDPDQHLVFNPDGTVSPADGPDGRPSEMGKETIRLLGLNRQHLITARQRVLAVVARSMENISVYEKLQEVYGPDPVFEEQLKKDRKVLADHADPTAPYSAAAAHLMGLRRA